MVPARCRANTLRGRFTASSNVTKDWIAMIAGDTARGIVTAAKGASEFARNPLGG